MKCTSFTRNRLLILHSQHSAADLHDPFRRLPVTVRVLPLFRYGKHPARGPDNPRSIGTRQHICPGLDRLRPLGILAQRNAGNPEDAGLLLDSPGVGEDQPGVSLKFHEFHVPDRLGNRNTPGINPKFRHHFLRAGVMHGKYDRDAEAPAHRRVSADDAGKELKKQHYLNCTRISVNLYYKLQKIIIHIHSNCNV